MHPARHAILVACCLLWLPLAPLARQAAPPLDDAAMEDFLRNGRIVQVRSAGKGVTDSTRATLQLGDFSHDVHIQTVDQRRPEYRTVKGIEFNFRDKWQFNVAAYRIDRLLGLHFVPVTVERRWNTDPASFTWWVDDVLMDEGERLKTQAIAPNQECWIAQRRMLRFFDQLIDNTDRNTGNLVISRTWRLWAIDHTRAFRRSKTLTRPDSLTHMDRRVLERLAALDFATLKREVGRYLEDSDIRALLVRRDALVAHFRAAGAAALYDRPEVGTGCLAAPAAIN